MRKSKAAIAGALLLVMVAAVVAANAQEKADSTAASTAAKPVAGTAPAAGTTAAAGTSSKAEAAAPKTGPQSIIGEVVDPACYLINGAKGEPHKECAIACAKSGQTLAILEKKTNKLYLLLTEEPGQDPNKGAIDYVAQVVLVKGKVRSRGGAHGIQVDSIELNTAAKTGGK